MSPTGRWSSKRPPVSSTGTVRIAPAVSMRPDEPNAEGVNWMERPHAVTVKAPPRTSRVAGGGGSAVRSLREQPMRTAASIVQIVNGLMFHRNLVACPLRPLRDTFIECDPMTNPDHDLPLNAARMNELERVTQ